MSCTATSQSAQAPPRALQARVEEVNPTHNLHSESFQQSNFARMPTSTAWLSRGNPSAQRGSSPVRPSEEFIERLSPEPATTPANIPTSSRVKRETNGQFLHGLGLSNTPLQDRTIPDTDGLYLDSNGRAHLGAKLKSPRQDLPATRTSRAPATRYHGPPKRPYSNHARTPSAMSIDDLANIAIATSPQFATSHSRPSTSYIQGYSDVNDRAAKRIKSERLFSAEFLGSEERPKSSREEDAELLLGLSRGFSFSKSHTRSNVTRSLPPAQPLPIPQENAQNNPLLHIKAPMSLEPPIELAPPTLDTSIHDTTPETPQQRLSSTIASFDPLQSPASHYALTTTQIKPSPNRPPHASESAEKPEYSDLEPEKLAKVTDQLSKKPAFESKAQSDIRDNLPGAGLEQDALQSQSVGSEKPREMRRIPVEASQPVCPVCKQINSNAGIGEATTKWINCEGSCDRWFHINCAGFSDHEVKKIAKFVCVDCEPVHGQTKFARTSTRTRAAPDYAALNEGVTKSTEDADTHHFVSKFKDGTIKYHKDDFARIRPELLNKELWENFDGMKRPFVVPSIWNPRFGKFAVIPQPTSDDQEHSTAEVQKSYVTYSSSGEILKESEDPKDATSAYTTVDEPTIDLDQDYLGMIMPRDLTVRKVAALVGNVLAPVIDVMKQQGLKKNPTLSEWADYYDDKQKKEVRNVISLEISHSRLGRLIRRPEVVRQIDLQDQVWELDSKNPPKSITVRKPVAFYCLMSVGDSFTDFHIDFGGSSVYYHILKGRKTFFFIPPTEKYLKKYEEWNNTPNQNSIWLGDWCDGNVTRVDLFPGDTAFIPAGWIHSVWTPEDSLVIGGNFLTRYDLDMQLKVVNIEKANGTPLMFRYPHFQRVMWYTLIKYLEDDPIPQSVIDDFLDDPEYAYVRPFPIWHTDANSANPDIEPEEDEAHQRTYSKSELRGLTPLRDYLYRTARIYADLPVKGKLDRAKNNAVKASVPKVYGDPMQLIREFAIFVAWVKGNETVPDWLYSDDDPTQEQDGKEAGKKAENFRIPGERVSTRRKTRKSDSPGPESRGSPDVEEKRESPTPKSLGPRIACAACRKKRPQQSCRHATKFDETAQQTLERTRTYSNVSIDIAKLARASPVVNSIEGSTAPPKQTPQLAPPATTSVDEDTIELSTSSDVAQSTAARMTSPFDQNGIAINGTPSTPGQSRDQPKKGRSKACDECRKSKVSSSWQPSNSHSTRADMFVAALCPR